MAALRYAITDRTQYGETEPERHAGLVEQATRLAADEIDYIQLREKDLSAQNLIGLAREILNALRASRSGTQLLVNSRADVALAAGAHGVHLPSGEDQLTPSQIRNLFDRHSDLGRDTQVGRRSDPLFGRHSERSEESPHFARTGNISPIVSISCHTLAEVRRAHKCGADLILFGPVFAKSIRGEIVVPETGLEDLKSACAAAAGTPLLALGGVTAAGTASCLAAGASGVAGIRLFR